MAVHQSLITHERALFESIVYWSCEALFDVGGGDDGNTPVVRALPTAGASVLPSYGNFAADADKYVRARLRAIVRQLLAVRSVNRACYTATWLSSLSQVASVCLNLYTKWCNKWFLKPHIVACSSEARYLSNCDQEQQDDTTDGAWFYNKKLGLLLDSLLASPQDSVLVLTNLLAPRPCEALLAPVVARTNGVDDWRVWRQITNGCETELHESDKLNSVLWEKLLAREASSQRLGFYDDDHNAFTFVDEVQSRSADGPRTRWKLQQERAKPWLVHGQPRDAFWLLKHVRLLHKDVRKTPREDLKRLVLSMKSYRQRWESRLEQLRHRIRTREMTLSLFL